MLTVHAHGDRERPPIQTTNLGPVPRAISHVRIRIHAYICACYEFQPPPLFFCLSVAFSFSHPFSLTDHCGAQTFSLNSFSCMSFSMSSNFHTLSSSISISLPFSISFSLYLVLNVFFPLSWEPIAFLSRSHCHPWQFSHSSPISPSSFFAQRISSSISLSSCTVHTYFITLSFSFSTFQSPLSFLLFTILWGIALTCINRFFSFWMSNTSLQRKNLSLDKNLVFVFLTF